MDERYSTNPIYWRNPTSPKQDDNRNHIYIYQAKIENQSKKKGLRAVREKQIHYAPKSNNKTNLQHKW